MNVWSEKNHVANVVIPVADAWAGDTKSHVVNMKNYKKCTFIIATGASVAATDGVITVQAGVSHASCATDIVFKYRTQIATVPDAAGSDVPTTLTTAAVTGFPMTASKAGGIYIIEVDAAVVAAGIAGGDHCSVTVTENSAGVQTGGIIAILSEPRYPQDILATVMD